MSFTSTMNGPQNIGLTKKEAKEFSFIRAIAAKADPSNSRLQEEAGFEFECSRAVEKSIHKTAQGFFVPDDVLHQKREFIAGVGGTGQYLVGTDHQGQSWIENLYKRMMVMQMGATKITGLTGDIAVPRMDSSHTAYWVAESDTPTESKPSMGQVTGTPHCLAAYNDISRKLLIQSSPAAEAMVKDDLARVLAIGIDLAALYGAGLGNEPAGIAATSGIGSVVGGENGLAPAHSHLVKLHTEVSQDNADVGKMGYLSSAKIRGKLLQTFINTTSGDTPLWTNDPQNPGQGFLNGMRAGVSNQVSDTLTKGTSDVCSSIFFGSWDQLILAFWSGLDILVDPFSLSRSGSVRVVAFQDCDVLVRHPQAFSHFADALSA